MSKILEPRECWMCKRKEDKDDEEEEEEWVESPYHEVYACPQCAGLIKTVSNDMAEDYWVIILQKVRNNIKELLEYFGEEDVKA